eukprot:CAMPEP_0115168584 /NCGR_PEP_ID=MMETSP0270-20121206/827_1 /TAXON_ID=71861 /ORGANISM="Scrippsiella trochoidea, Strain CCMP3099" /LENGTH=155 /DNA_ID=CAMNT_0002581253 /DNA_START=275 /DNA_END=739 /DNA_ORIENTATION=+
MGDANCHQLVNEHCCLVLNPQIVSNTERFGSHFKVPFGERVAFGRAGEAAATKDRLHLVLTDKDDNSNSYPLELNLDRASEREISEMNARVCVKLQDRVAVVIVSHVSTAAAQNIVWGYDLEVRVPQLSIALVTETPRGEAFCLTLKGFELRTLQ